jgi:hydroxymethylglutaryl-CoA synthase
VTAGIVGWGTYLPHWRLDRSAIASFLGTSAGKGSRSVASYDEDPATMAVEAGMRALAAAPALTPEALYFSTPEPPYLDKTNATVVHAALGLPRHAGAWDLCGSVRSGWSALDAALAAGTRAPALAIVSDVRTGLPGGADEREAGDGAAALVFGPDGAVAEAIGSASATAEFLDRWRLPGEDTSQQWEERFGEQLYVPLVRQAFDDALKAAGTEAEAIDYLIVAGLHTRAVRALQRSLGARVKAMAPDVGSSIGNLGAAQLATALADVLERAEPGQLVATVLAADGADARIWRTTDRLPAVRASRAEAGATTFAEQVAEGTDVPYSRFLTWRGQLHQEPPRRPDPERPGAPVTRRSDEWKHGFAASRCVVCGFRHLPPTRVCLRCKAVDQMQSERLGGVRATVATMTVDRLAFSLSPPVIGVVIDFDEGGRFRCEMTDADPEDVRIGARARMTFRRVYTAQRVHNYFWKATLTEGADDGQ